MKRKNLFVFVLVCVFTFISFVTISLAADYPAMKLKTTSWFPAQSFTNQMVEWFAQEIEKRTSGKITFERYYGGALLKGGEHLEGIQHGVADFGVISPSYTPGKTPLAYSDYAFPFAPRKAKTAVILRRQIYNEFPWMEDELTGLNLKLIYFGTACDYGLLSRNPVRSLADLKGMKVVQLGGYFADWTRAGGINPLSGVSSSDRYERMRSGVVDGS